MKLHSQSTVWLRELEQNISNRPLKYSKIKSLRIRDLDKEEMKKIKA